VGVGYQHSKKTKRKQTAFRQQIDSRYSHGGQTADRQQTDGGQTDGTKAEKRQKAQKMTADKQTDQIDRQQTGR
jgi:hypothetical protein